MLEIVDVQYPGLSYGHAELSKFYVVRFPHLRSFSQAHRVGNDRSYPTELLDQLSYLPTCSVALNLLLSGRCADDMRILGLFPAPHFRETNLIDIQRTGPKLIGGAPRKFTATSGS